MHFYLVTMAKNLLTSKMDELFVTFINIKQQNWLIECFLPIWNTEYTGCPATEFAVLNFVLLGSFWVKKSSNKRGSKLQRFVMKILRTQYALRAFEKLVD